MFQGYRKIFWGLFFSTFHINYGPFPILPAFVGWLIIASGVKALRESNETGSFHKAHYTALAVAVLTFIGFYVTSTGVSYDLQKYQAIVVEILVFIFVYYLLKGSIECLRACGIDSTAAYYERVLSIYMIIFSINTVFLCIALAGGNPGLTFFTAVFGLFLMIWLMLISSRLRKMEDVSYQRHKLQK